MEFVIAFIILALLWILRKTIRIWAHVSENASESKAREVLVTVAKVDIHTAKEVQTLIANDVSINRDEMDAFLFDGRKPTTT
jgi:hypothetical protein